MTKKRRLKQVLIDTQKKVSPSIGRLDHVNEKIDFANKQISDLSQVVRELSTALQNIEHSVQALSAQSADLTTRQEAIASTLGRQSVALSDFDIRTTDRAIRVVFLVHNIEVWSSLDAVYREMMNNKAFAVTVVSIHRKYPSGSSYKGEETTHQGLDNLGIEHIRLRNAADSYLDLDVIKRMRPDVIFRQSQWDNDMPPAFSIKNLTFAKLYSVPYAIMPLTVHSVSPDNPDVFRRSSESFFLVNEEVKQYYEKYDRLSTNLIVSGHPRVDEILSSKQSWPLETGNKFKVLWSAHHSIFSGWNDFGTFLDMHDDMLRIAQKHADIDFVFSLHPGLIGAFERLHTESPQKSKEATEFFRQWDELPNTATLENGGYIPLMRASDMLITDGVSLLMEYQLMQKPLVYIEKKGHSDFNELGELVYKGLNVIAEEDVAHQLEETIVVFKSGKKDDRKKYQQDTTQFLTEKKHAAKNIVVHIKDEFAKK